MAKLSEEILTIVFQLQRQMLLLMDEAGATDLAKQNKRSLNYKNSKISENVPIITTCAFALCCGESLILSRRQAVLT